MIVGGGALLLVFERIGWTWTFVSMATLVAATSIPILISNGEDRRIVDEGRRPARRTNFFRRPYAVRVLSLLTVYKFGEAFAVGMLRPFLADVGLSLGDIGWLVGTVGFVAGLLGALAGGATVTRLGRRRSLVAFALLQAATVFGYAYAARGHVGIAVLSCLCAAEHFASGMATAALFTCMMDWSDPETSATDYTIQASAVVIATGAATSLSGFSAQALGYANHFLLAGVLALAVPPLVRALFPGANAETCEPVEVASCR
jgi:predicted MFS family arabinose efflux permease